jgi:hypothetical protein
MVRLFIYCAISLLITYKAIASTADPEAIEAEEQLSQSQRDSLQDLLINRQPAILHPPIYSDEVMEDEVAASARISDQIGERGDEPSYR